ncbi:amino acid racemase [Candidatus Shapirobacteria bacterium]|nr:amino acid racemase [Candidatus Shapirobacteria bacterium]
MKTIGIVGITAEGGSLCYKTIVSEAAKILGDYKHPEIVLVNPEFLGILEAQRANNWDKVAEICVTAIKKLESIGADLIIIPGNSIHFAFEKIKNESNIPVISIVETAAEECVTRGFKKVAVLGVGITMSSGLYKESLEGKGIEYRVPEEEQQKIINKIIYEEIVPARVTKESVGVVIKIIEKLKEEGCDGVILGCTELPIIITEDNSPIPFIDTTRLLAKKVLEMSLK